MYDFDEHDHAYWRQEKDCHPKQACWLQAMISILAVMKVGE
jgi:hypothetical protein